MIIKEGMIVDIYDNFNLFKPTTVIIENILSENDGLLECLVRKWSNFAINEYGITSMVLDPAFIKINVAETWEYQVQLRSGGKI